MNENIEEKFRQKLLGYSNANNGKFSIQTVERVILNSTDEDMTRFLNFIDKDENENGRSSIEAEGTIIELAEKYQISNARELIEQYRKLWRV